MEQPFCSVSDGVLWSRSICILVRHLHIRLLWLVYLFIWCVLFSLQHSTQSWSRQIWLCIMWGGLYTVSVWKGYDRYEQRTACKSNVAVLYHLIEATTEFKSLQEHMYKMLSVYSTTCLFWFPRWRQCGWASWLSHGRKKPVWTSSSWGR